MHNRWKFTTNACLANLLLLKCVLCSCSKKQSWKSGCIFDHGASFAFCIAPTVMGTLICTDANYLCRIAISQVISTLQLWLASWTFLHWVSHIFLQYTAAVLQNRLWKLGDRYSESKQNIIYHSRWVKSTGSKSSLGPTCMCWMLSAFYLGMLKYLLCSHL